MLESNIYIVWHFILQKLFALESFQKTKAEKQYVIAGWVPKVNAWTSSKLCGVWNLANEMRVMYVWDLEHN